MKKISTLFTALFAVMSLYAADIYEIRPFLRNTDPLYPLHEYVPSVDQARRANVPYATAESPLEAGKQLFFNVRLVARTDDVPRGQPAGRFQLDYVGGGSRETEWAVNPPMIGIFVGDTLKYARMVQAPKIMPYNYYDASYGNTLYLYDMVFKYTVEPGDLGLPIRLALKDGQPATSNYDDPSASAPVTEYLMKNVGMFVSSDPWRINYYKNESDTPSTEKVVFSYAPSRQEPSYKEKDGTSETENPAQQYCLFSNFTLSQCGFYVQTVDFDRDEERNPGWRKVREGKTNQTSIEIIDGEMFATNSIPETTLYVWAVSPEWLASGEKPVVTAWDPDPAVEVVGKEVPITIGKDDTGTAIQRPVKMATVTVKEHTLYANFSIKGLKKDKRSTLILSSSKDFSYNSAVGYTLDKDFITCEVECIEGQPELMLKLTELKDVYTVTSDYTNTLTTMKLTLTDAYEEEINVTITPNLTKPGTYKWKDVVHISDSTDPRMGWRPAVPLVVTIPKGSTASFPVYLYGMGASADQNLWTSGLGQEVTFTLEPDKGETFIKKITTDTLYVRPASPEVANKAELQAMTISGGDELEFVMRDNYTDMDDTKTGYTIRAYWCQNGQEPPTKTTDRRVKTDGIDIATPDGVTTFKPDSDGILTALKDGKMLAGELPVVPADVRGDYLRFWITAPNTAQAAYFDLTISTKPKAFAYAYAGKTSAEKPDSFAEIDAAGDPTLAYIGVDLETPNKSGDDLYAYLKLKDETQKNLVSGRCIITDGSASRGIRIRSNESVEASRAEIKLLDGIADDTILQFEVVLCTKEPYDPNKVYTKFDVTTPLEVVVENVKPEVNNISMSGWNLDPETKTFEGSATKNIDQYFTFDIKDATRDLEGTGTDRFALTYQFKGCSPTYSKSVTYYGNPADLIVTNDFSTTGTATLTVTLTDKDGGKTGPLSYTFTVSDTPYITITNKDEIRSFYEDESPTFWVNLSENPAKVPLTVELTVTPKATGDKRGDLQVGGDFQPKPGAEGVYLCTYVPGVTACSFYVSSADGASGGSRFDFTAKVTTETFIPETETPWSKFYREGILSSIEVKNAKPSMTIDGHVCRAARSVAGESDDIIYLNASNAPIQVAVGGAEPITWSVNDVAADLKKGVTMTIRDAYGSHKFPVHDTDDEMYTPQFKDAGSFTVELTATDTDGGSITAVRFYVVKSERMLSVAAIGPSQSGLGSPSVSHYRGTGLGQGHVFVGNATCTGANAWIFDYNCGLAQNVPATAQGYRKGDVDNGTLTKNGSLGDIPITPEGSLAKDEPYFPYEGERDSFFYCWVKVSVGDDGLMSSTFYSGTPEVTLADSARFVLPTQADDAGAYPLTMFEAYFAREYLATDNVGDINADGIPDIYALGYEGFGISARGDEPNDMTNLRQFNDDEDYFPFIFDNAQDAFVFMPSDSWTSNTRKFTAELEIRGWGRHLNDAYQVLAAQGYAGKIPAFTADRNYTNDFTVSTLTELEYDAWVQAGRDPNWSPERPTDPTNADTDGDGMPDGYEYYIWYKAHVGWIDGNGVHQYATGRKYNPANPYDPIVLTSAEIAAAFDPLTNSGSEWDTRDTDDDGLTDYAEYILGTNPFDYDTDKDGLPDGYEVSFTGTDPLKADSNDNGIADGNENPDNDSIAEYSKDMLFVTVIGASGTEYYCCDGAGLNDYSNAVATATHKGTRFEIVTGGGTTTNTLVTTYAITGHIYTNDAGKVCLGTGFSKKNTWQCTKVGDDWVRTAEPTDDQVRLGTAIENIVEDAEYRDYNLASAGEAEVGTWYAAYPYQDGYARGKSASFGAVSEKGALLRAVTGIKLLHYQVYQEKGFHSSTGWIHPPSGGVDTRSFTSMDEFLSMVFFHKTGSLSEADMAVTPLHTRIWIWQHYSTHPTNADTDGDMMPDGWEFYVMANTGDKGPTWHYSPLYSFNHIPDGATRDNDNDLLQWPEEYSGMSSSSRYGWSPLKPTWRNKAEPTDPWDPDTDEDGIKDGFEGGYGDADTLGGVVAQNLMYNTTGTSGGGLNPLSWDTDGDGLPDPWELEFHGTYKPGTTSTQTSTEITENSTNTVTTTVSTGVTWNMDGMNATVDDAHVDYDHDGLVNWQEYMVGTMRCWRYDDPESGWGVHHASEDELMAILALGPGSDEWNRYWGERLVDKSSANYNPNFANGYFDAGASYFSCCRKDFDPANGNWYYLYDGIYHEQATDFTWSLMAGREFLEKLPYIQTAPKRYICCDPRNPDTDYDGMDDYYELFHGMNPMLGMPAVGDNGRQPCDIVYDAYNRSFLDPARESATGVSALNNWWRNTEKPHSTGMATGIKHPEKDGYDFVAYPWLNGIASADPDGDNIVNQEEAIMPKVQAASTYHHTDPTPLWMTDSAYTNSLTRRYYRVSAPQGENNLTSWGYLFAQEPTFEWGGKTYKLSDFPGFTYKANSGQLSFSYLLDTFFGSYAWYYSFEENEGYDSDHDYLSDYEEGQGKTKSASDPQSHDSPLRRQAMYFNGVDAFLETPVATTEWDPDSPDSSTEARQNFLYYTVECWAKPDVASLKNDNTVRTLVERAIWADNASAADEELLRKNFLIGIKNGRWYTCFDSSGTDIQPVEVADGPVATTNWTHIAASYDGTALRLYVNGICSNIKATSIQPEHGVAALALNKVGEMNPTGGTLGHATDEHDEDFIAILVGASALNKNGIVFDWAWRYRNYQYVDEKNPEGLCFTNETTFADYGNFYKGYIDEVRIWDGARSAADIQSDVDNRVRYTADLAMENRQAVYNNWKIGGLRSPASETQLPPQLMYHWAFDQIPGAVLTNDVAKVPAGFNTAQNVLNAKARWSRPADYVERNWNSSAVRSTVYTDNAWVPWLNNTVAHLPRFDLTTIDSIYWSEDYAGAFAAVTNGYLNFQFPRTAEVYSRWTQRTYNGPNVFYCIYLDPDFHYLNGVDGVHGVSDAFSCAVTDQRSRWDVVSGYGSAHLTPQTKEATAIQTELALAFRFALRDRYTCGDDILPMGGAYPRRISAAEGGMWDAKVSELPKASDAWAQTGNDADGNGLPDWWEEYARENYCDTLDPRLPLEWDTTVTYCGIQMPAYQAYLRDLARGMVKIGPTVKYDTAYADTRDADRDGLPDWWEEMYGLNTSVANADEDLDNDGLSNYQEYILGEYYLTMFADQFKAKGIDVSQVNLSPVLAFSTPGQVVPDYFLCYTNRHDEIKTGNQSHFFTDEYFGEIATDHDFMEDWWEQLFDISYTNSKKYDPSFDKDGDGWSTYAECRAALWGGYFAANFIDKWAIDDPSQYLSCYPQPIIGVRATYYGKQDISGMPLVVRTTSGQTARTDATFVVPADAQTQTRYIGAFAADQILHGHLSPGMIDPTSISFQRALTGDEKQYYWSFAWYEEHSTEGGEEWGSERSYGTFAEYLDVRSRWPMIQLEDSDLPWEAFVQSVDSADGTRADLYIDSTWFGYVNCTTGEYELDMSKFSGDKPFDQYTFRVTYSGRIGHSWPQTVYLSDTRELSGGTGDGYVREGKNTIEAFIDLDGDGTYTPGEPYGVVQNVDVGWQKVPVTVIELKDTTHVVPRFNVATSTDDRAVVAGTAGGTTQGGGEGAANTGLTKTLTIKRIAINGSDAVMSLNNVSVSVPKRILATKTLVLDSRSYLTEADVLGNAKFDLDSRWLVRDAEDKLGIKRSEIDNATYEISEVVKQADGTTTNVILATFVNTFNPQRTRPTAVAPVDQAPVYAGSPTFSFSSGDETMTAYRLQVAKTDGTLVYDSGDGTQGNNLLLLPGRTPNTAGTAVYMVTPPIYADARVCSGMITNNVFADSQDYKWRVALFNAKFNEIEKDEDWSDWAEFQMDVGNNNRYPKQATGYGSASISVRYYGPTNTTPDRVWVEAFENADFRGQPAARATLSSIARLADYTDIAHTNALVSGLAPGTYYFRAFIDLNGNGQRDDWESWGYYNYVGKGMKALYNPRAFVVTAATSDWLASGNADFTIFIEDCDTDQNEYPDCLEASFYSGSTGTTATDSDGDGIADSDEETYSTNPQLADTDNDGMPDGYEALFADTDPTLSDADECVAGDVMAFATREATLIVVSANGTDKTTYMLEKGQTTPKRGDDAKGLVVRTTYTYPVWEDGKSTEYRGVGTNLTLTAGTKVVSVDTAGSVVLVHKQVYDTYGFNPKTCVADLDAVNTKAFTALDKYLVVRYLEAQGLANEAAVNKGNLWKSYTLKPYEIDNDADGIADGWELYTGLNPWSYDDARQLSAGGEGITNLEEYDGGNSPTDPNNPDTDGDSVSDKYAYQYHLKGDEASADNDGDGLSNYAEYLISEVFKFAKLDPDNPKTDMSCVDYFRKYGDLYFGEMFTDYDQVDDAWEKCYENKVGQSSDLYANRAIQDAGADRDRDGWSNYAEAKAGTSPEVATSQGVDGEVLKEYPVPAIEARLTYNGGYKLTAPIIFQAWSEKTDPDMTGLPDAAWRAASDETPTNVTKYVGVNPGTTRTYYLGTGSVSPGSVRIDFRDMMYERATVYNGEEVIGRSTLGEVGNAKWFYFVQDREGVLYTSATNLTAAAPVAVGTIDYGTGRMTVDFGCAALQGYAYDYTINGDSATDDEAKNTGLYANCDKLNLARSYVKINWTPAKPDTTGNATYYLSDCTTAVPNCGYVREGRNKFVVFSDTDGDGAYTPGEPFGFVGGVDVGWQGGAFEVELTTTSPVFARVDLTSTSGAATDRQAIQPDDSTVKDTSDIPTDVLKTLNVIPYGTTTDEDAGFGAGTDSETTTDDKLIRVRVVRAFVDGSTTLGKDSDGNEVPVDKAVVMDKYFDLGVRNYIHEGDFLGDASFDIGWSELQENVYARDTEVGGYIDATNITYMIVLGEGEISAGSNKVFHCFIDRRYDSVAARQSRYEKPVIDKELNPSVAYGAKPTFRWSMSDMAGNDNNSYTAFRLRIYNGKTAGYDSGYRVAPPRVKMQNGKGETHYYYEWTLDEPLGSLIGPGTNYQWTVGMFNAKFRDATFWDGQNDSWAFFNGGESESVATWATPADLVVDMNQQQKMNDHGYSTVAATVKYAGPACVLDKGTVVLQAFSTADFAGSPMGESYVGDAASVANTALNNANGFVRGLPANGTYYLRAFIDMNGNRVRDAWESWGAANESVTLTSDTTACPTVGIYIEDVDTDADWIPDAYEYAKKGSLYVMGPELIGGDKIKFNTTIYSAVGTAGFSTWISGASLTVFQNETLVKMALANLDATLSIDALRKAVEKKINPNTVKITAIALSSNGKYVTLSLGAEVTDSTAGALLGKVYDVTGLSGLSATVKVKVYKKNTLAEAGWTLVDTQTATFLRDDVEVIVPVNNVNMTSGFYKIEIEQ